MRSLLDNRKGMTPRDSMEALVKYARNQDDAVKIRKIRHVRAFYLLHFVGIGLLAGYAINETMYGYWPQIHPRNTALLGIEVAATSKRNVYAPEIYLKDLQRYNKDLMNKNLQALKAESVHSEH